MTTIHSKFLVASPPAMRSARPACARASDPLIETGKARRKVTPSASPGRKNVKYSENIKEYSFFSSGLEGFVGSEKFIWV